MKKLELKYVAPYLPYGLKIERPFLVWSGLPPEPSHDEWGTEILTIDNISHYFRESESGWFQIILRPLSDLTKEIEHDGKRFIPMDYIAEECENDYFEESPFLDDYMEQFMQSYHTQHHLNFIPYGLIQLLVSWHFDVFNLIEQGLAIDINFLNQ